MPPATRSRAWIGIAVWAAAAAAFAHARVPYDDEWFSITLVRDTTSTQMWRSLANDVHPPWVTALDRAVHAATGSLAALTVLRIGCSAAAVALLTCAAPRLGIRRWAFALAAFHPIVLMYGAALRWYPFALLADAARLWALTRDPAVERERRGAAGAFVAGAALGVLSSYAEAVLVAIDACAWLVRGARRGELGRALRVVALAAVLPLASLLAWPPFFASLRATMGGLANASALRAAGAFLALGPLGEAHLPPPATLAALLALPGIGLALRRAWRREATRPLTFALARATAGWLACSALGFGHPRYALLVWLVLAALVVDATVEATILAFVRAPERAPRGRVTAAALTLTTSYLLLGLGLTLGQRSFVRGNLNAIAPSTCAAVLVPRPELVFAPYPGLAVGLARTCRPEVRVVSAGWIRHYAPDDDALFADARAALSNARTVTLATVPARDSSLEITQRRAHDWLAARCRAVDAVDVQPDPWAGLKALVRVHDVQASFRVHVERFDCP